MSRWMRRRKDERSEYYKSWIGSKVKASVLLFGEGLYLVSGVFDGGVELCPLGDVQDHRFHQWHTILKLERL